MKNTPPQNQKTLVHLQQNAVCLTLVHFNTTITQNDHDKIVKLWYYDFQAHFNTNLFLRVRTSTLKVLDVTLPKIVVLTAIRKIFS